MSDASQLVDPKQFATLAGNDIHIWELCVGQHLQHADNGLGVIESVIQKGKAVELKMDFESLSVIKRMRADVLFKSGKVTAFWFPLSIDEIKAIRKQMDELGISFDQLRNLQQGDIGAASNFVKLKIKYRVAGHSDVSPNSPLYNILLKFENDQELERSEYEWLKEQNLFAAMALHQERRYVRSGDKWRMVYASSFWRQAQLPEEALRITENLTSTDPKIMAAILTTRGAAFADRRDFQEAERYAHLALKQYGDHPHPHPYVLLAKIYTDRGNPKQAKHYSEKAAMLGDMHGQ